MGITRNLIVFDTETTGLSPYLGCEVVEIAACGINYANLDDHHEGVFHCYIKPQRPEKAQQGALNVIGETWDKALKEGLPPQIAWKNFIEWARKIDHSNGKKKTCAPIAFAHNIEFDRRFTEFHCHEYNVLPVGQQGYIEYPWSWWFDAMTLDFALFSGDPQVDKLTLDATAARLGMERKTDKHTAIEDIQILKNKIVRQLKFFRECNKRMKIMI